MHAEGSNGSVTLDGDQLRIRHKGWASAMTKGLQGEKVIPVSNVTSVQFRPASGFMAGYIQFSLLGGFDRPGGILEATKDENAVLFERSQQNTFETLRAEMERRLVASAAPAPTGGVASELERLAGLVDRGFLSRDEFEAQKRALLQA
ncbi:DUF4429 domain-containing protein [Terricaulis silvestris]|uniref:SHOCT domain-containing protein n=1 Tax=Terricaulis silvestris TaxID=2686094 RepID=A0A6I6MSW2_9CAUL|nr:DUF4429 domain-containing protein [Terricaulis silvestris]QGZ96516.1 hypothetical protein DSM104635_03376 [Terricaulis silvestris]